MSTATPTRTELWSVADHTAAAERFYQGMAIACLAAVFAGFARTYFLKSFTGWPPAPAIVHWHGALFTSWFVLFLAQTMLIATGRLQWHRRLGVAAVGLAVAMIVLGLMMTVQAAREGFTGVFPPPRGAPLDAISFSVQGFVDMGLFATFLVAALWWRGRPDVHKRLMLLATISLLPAATVRIPLPGSSRLVLALALALAFAMAQPLYDRLTRGKIHPVGLWGGLAFLASVPLRVVAGGTDAWHAFVVWLLGF
jgi:uncharacterized membrane protein YozB (DUF420 family)